FTLICRGNLASTYTKQHRWKEAEDLEMKVVEGKRRLLGEEHRETLISMNNLAARRRPSADAYKHKQTRMVYKVQGRLREAEEVELQAADMSSRVLGEDHLFTLICRGNLASTYTKQHRWKEAEDLEMKVVEGK
ncbi:tetratricopeptide repeat-containing protein, partial [Staphylococcus xylosus]|nr:tetratricopeptide repeat-containing protein [Staphylococcus xylosus]